MKLSISGTGITKVGDWLRTGISMDGDWQGMLSS